MPFLITIPLQLLAYHVALLKNCDIDKPRNLAKSVTGRINKDFLLKKFTL